MIYLQLTNEDAGRVLAGLKERQRKLKRGVTKFGADFDPVLGANMAAGLAEYDRLIPIVEKAIAHA